MMKIACLNLWIKQKKKSAVLVLEIPTKFISRLTQSLEIMLKKIECRALAKCSDFLVKKRVYVKYQCYESVW